MLPKGLKSKTNNKPPSLTLMSSSPKKSPSSATNKEKSISSTLSQNSLSVSLSTVATDELEILSNNDNRADSKSIVTSSTVITNNNNMNARVNKKMKELPENLRLNGKTPSGKVRLFVCEICTRAFARQEHLVRHERSHTKEKPYNCGICSKKFTRRDLLIRHAQKVHNGNVVDTVAALKAPLSSTASASTSRRKSSISNKKTKSNRKILKRRASFSAQSAKNYANAELKNFDIRNSIEKIAFSTPELLPIDFRINDPFLSNDNLNLNINNNDNDNNSNLNVNPFISNHFQGDFLNSINYANNKTNNNNIHHSTTANIPIEFSLLDSTNWVNDYNNNNIPSTSASDERTSPLEKIHEENEEAQPDIQQHTQQLVVPYQPLNLRTTSSLTLEDNNDKIEVKSLFSNNTKDIIDEINQRANKLNNKLDENSNLDSTSNIFTPPSISPFDFDKLSSLGDLFPSQINEEDPFNLQNPTFVDLFQTDFSLIGNDIGIENRFSNLNQQIPTPLDKITTSGNPYFHDLFSNNHSNIGNSDSSTNIHNNITNDGYSSSEALLQTNYIDPRLQLNNNKSSMSSSSTTNADGFYDSNNNPTLPAPVPILFTSKLYNMCTIVLNYFNKNKSNNSQHSTVPTTVILPDCDELNDLLIYFEKHFLSHYPFIHKDIFNFDFLSLTKYVYEIDDDLIIEQKLNEGNEMLKFASLVCLPLFMCTFGSTFKHGGSNPKTKELYEASRRVLSVYLEVKKENQNNHNNINKNNDSSSSSSTAAPNNNTENPTQHIWLIQSLTLSIMFAFTADYSHKIDTELLKRQLSAICSIIRTNFLREISISLTKNHDELIFSSAFEYVMFESKIRCTVMIYKFCQFLEIFFNFHSKLFIKQNDIQSICIPDDEIIWNMSPLLLTMKDPTLRIKDRKQHPVTFQQFYNSFVFNDTGLNMIPEFLATAMLFYEYSSNKNSSNFHIFLTKIDTKKLEINIAQPLVSNSPNFDSNSDDNNFSRLPYFKISPSKIMKQDATVVKNCLMTIYFFNGIDQRFSSKIWENQIPLIFNEFLSSRNNNLLTKGSYSLLTNFLISLNCSIQNISKLISFDKSTDKIVFNTSKFSLFNIQGYYYNFLSIIKFLLDFEETPNFKLLCIFTELNKLANKIFIPEFLNICPQFFEKFDDINKLKSEANSATRLSSINIEKLEKLIDNVLVYSFNDTSYLNMSEQTTNEFLFGVDHSNLNFNTTVDNDDDNNITRNKIHNNNKRTMGQSSATQSSVDLVSLQRKHADNSMDMGNHFHNINKNHCVNKQTFEKRYHLSTKYIVIAKSFFTFVNESYVQWHFIDKIINDFKELERLLSFELNERSLSKLKLEAFN
ncbi:DNA-binding transcription factor ADR1 NDAI_0C04860 [Naumovozyma dairenensis CBS 421]|uniref:C2H2-type domain-containing protein n=1 Tax=Naumovozyma dairenensis (strain ATCC 10597 / BCRC 20456 / CBS 421 / NBRC 0211 / NRRL Y-12639) TaxID=1071378 RepID=G0W8N4_NAUDC|nr:hypothetical protein NDAI_0C04860 [Naumovozyma dairenensis CBS 421]CCD24145.1 hypothetical protein NDAI_0C04860 [Naumovozyma dairenensis CBS 421]